MRDVFICDAARTSIGRYGGALAKVRTDDLAAVPIKALVARNAKADWSRIDDVYFGCANQAGEDNRNVARMALLLAGLPDCVPGVTVNRLCASGLNAVGDAARAIRAGEMDFAIAGGVESMTRAPFVMGKAAEAFQRSAEVFDTTIGWRFVNPLMKAQYGVDSMPETGENVAEDFQVTRKDQDAFALRSQKRAVAAQAKGTFDEEIVAVEMKDRKGNVTRVASDEHPRSDTTLEALAKLRPAFHAKGRVTAGNSPQTSDGAAAVVVMSGERADALGAKPLARFVAFAYAGCAPEEMGIGPVYAIPKALRLAGLTLDDIDVIELNEAFAAQSLAVMKAIGLDPAKVNVNGGAIALGHPLGCTGAKLTATLLGELKRKKKRYGMVTMCVGGGMGAAGIFENLQN